MGLRRGVIALGIFGGALPWGCEAGLFDSLRRAMDSGRTDRTQLACVELPQWRPTNFKCLTVTYAVGECCKGGTGYFALGGHQRKLGHHNEYMCVSDVRDLVGEFSENVVDLSNCNVGCPGPAKTFDAKSTGMCGGGCRNCVMPEYPCTGDATAECGVYKSVYSCNQRETSLTLPKTRPDKSTGGKGGPTNPSKQTYSPSETSKTNNNPSTTNYGSSNGQNSIESSFGGSNKNSLAGVKQAKGPLSNPIQVTVRHNDCTVPTKATFYHPFYPKSLLEP